MEDQEVRSTGRIQENHVFDVLVQASQGHLQAIDDVLAWFSNRIDRFCDRLIKDKHGRWEGSWKDRDDLKQQVKLQIVVALLKGKQTYNSVEHFERWAWTIAHNVCVEGWKRSNRESSRRDDRPVEELEHLAPRSLPETSVVAEQWLSILSEEDRRMVTLSVIEGYNTRQIAKILKTNHTFVARRLKKALGLVRARLEPGAKETVK